jgi:hypothetical protein
MPNPPIFLFFDNRMNIIDMGTPEGEKAGHDDLARALSMPAEQKRQRFTGSACEHSEVRLYAAADKSGTCGICLTSTACLLRTELQDAS